MSDMHQGASPLRPVGSALPKMRRANRLPVYAAIGVVVLSGAVIIYGIASRGLYRSGPDWTDGIAGLPPSNFGDRLKEGIPDGIIDAPQLTPVPTLPLREFPVPVVPKPAQPAEEPPVIDNWQERLVREHDEQMLRELQRQQLAALQADRTALDAPIAVAIGDLQPRPDGPAPLDPGSSMRADLSGLYRAASQQALVDADQQAAKEAFLEQGGPQDGVLVDGIVQQQSPYELKRGSVIPAVLITGINSDLPGRIIAQVSQNVFDSATGHHLLIPQGTKLFGRYDSDVTFGQDRVLVVWTDLVLPNGDTLGLKGMAGSDSQGFGGFADEVDRHFLEIFGSALLVGVIGAGVDMLMPDQQGNGQEPEDAARSSFAESFGQAGSKTMDRNLDVQPTLTIRPGYVFNVTVEQDIRFERDY